MNELLRATRACYSLLLYHCTTDFADWQRTLLGQGSGGGEPTDARMG